MSRWNASLCATSRRPIRWPFNGENSKNLFKHYYQYLQLFLETCSALKVLEPLHRILLKAIGIEPRTRYLICEDDWENPDSWELAGIRAGKFAKWYGRFTQFTYFRNKVGWCSTVKPNHWDNHIWLRRIAVCICRTFKCLLILWWPIHRKTGNPFIIRDYFVPSKWSLAIYLQVFEYADCSNPLKQFQRLWVSRLKL